MVKFNACNHQYTANGEIIPSVTQVLSSLNDFSSITPDVLENASQRGTAIHAMVDLYINKKLDLSALDARLYGRLAAWIEFTNLYLPNIIGCEKLVYSAKHGFAGTLDIVCLLEGKLSLIDIKSSKAAASTANLQLAGYQIAYEEMVGVKVSRRMAVILKDDGKFEVLEYKCKLDKKAFLKLLKDNKNEKRAKND